MELRFAPPPEETPQESALRAELRAFLAEALRVPHAVAASGKLDGCRSGIQPDDG